MCRILENSDQAVLYRWYDEGLMRFRSNSSSAQSVADILHDELGLILDSLGPQTCGERCGAQQADIDSLSPRPEPSARSLEGANAQGRDQLLELIPAARNGR